MQKKYFCKEGKEVINIKGKNHHHSMRLRILWYFSGEEEVMEDIHISSINFQKVNVNLHTLPSISPPSLWRVFFSLHAYT